MKRYELTYHTQKFYGEKFGYSISDRLIKAASQAQCESRAIALRSERLADCKELNFKSPDKKRGQVVHYQLEGGELSKIYRSWTVSEARAVAPAGAKRWAK